MIILITGGSKCGKSSAAESLLNGFAGKKYYIAAMEPYGEDALRAIARHREMRRGKGFETIERPRDIGGLMLPESGLPRCALLECLTTLCANEMFTPGGITDPSEKIIQGIKKLAAQNEKLVIVTNEYIRIMSRLNSRVAALADTVTECVCGIPLVLKGELK